MDCTNIDLDAHDLSRTKLQASSQIAIEEKCEIAVDQHKNYECGNNRASADWTLLLNRFLIRSICHSCNTNCKGMLLERLSKIWSLSIAQRSSGDILKL